ncbi:MAG TPA: ComEC/Rec2 family competence protein [Lacipirellulaceae bacterium]|nr:ComEC/Rec2 family competence protein [Lacipirellulaceae bacterium]
MDASASIALRQEVSPSTTLAMAKRAANGADKSLRYQPLITVLIAAALGIVLNRYAADAIGLSATSWCALAAALLIAWWYLWRTGRDRSAALPLLIGVVLSAAAWHDLRWNTFSSGEIARFARYDAAPACIEAVALEMPERVAAPDATPLRAIPGVETSRLLVKVTAVRDGTSWRAAAGVCQLQVGGHLLGVRAGERIRVFGQLGRARPPQNPGEFDFAAHARADRQLARMRSTAPECVTILGPGSRWSASQALDALRNGGKRIVHQHVGPQHAALASAILLGAREGLHYDQTEPYLVTGTIHVLVVSGVNVAILAVGLLGLMRMGWISRRTSLAIIIVVVIGYALVAEVQPPVVRAAVLGILICIAAWTGRRGAGFNSLACAAIVVLAINPADLFRPGPQLSFLAVATLIWVGTLYLRHKQHTSDRLDQMLAAARPWYFRTSTAAFKWTGWLLMTSFAVWLVSLPLVLSQFHVVSPIAVLISPAVWLCAIAAMWSGFLLLVGGWLIPILGPICGAICSASLGGLEHVVGWAEAVPGGHFWAPGPAWWWLVGFYAMLVAAMLWGRALAPPRWQVAALCAWILVGLVPPISRATSREGIECSFVAVGHGTCVVLETPTGETLLYDAGALASPEYATQTIASYLWHRGIMRIDGLVISHADVDHYNAVPGLLERFRVGTVYVSPVMFDGFGDQSALGGTDVLRRAIHRAAVPVREVWAGDRLRIGRDLAIEVLHPPRDGVLGNDNANSITLAVEYRGKRVLLPGDLESPGLEDVIAERPYDCDVVLAPHHGSRYSDPPGFAAWSTPEWVVISGGRGDAVAPVIATYENEGAYVVRTHDTGLVKFAIDSDMIRIDSMHGPN